jgi:alkylated DNA repair dioxygenase AlkB
MDLFANETTNLLPMDGCVNYFSKIFTEQQSNFYYNKLMDSIDWKNDQAMMFGKLITTKRKVAWYGSFPFEYTYSNITKKALSWTKELLALKLIAEQKTKETYNSCLLNLYHTGNEGMAWHSDGEKDLKPNINKLLK